MKITIACRYPKKKDLNSLMYKGGCHISVSLLRNLLNVDIFLQTTQTSSMSLSISLVEL